MEVISLQSGSSGNCVFVCNGDTRLLFDAGISASKAETRLRDCGHDIRECQALILSHEHYDHISGLGPFHRRFGLPVHANLRTWNAARAKPSTGSIGSPSYFVSGTSFQIGSLKIEPIRTPHDAIEGVCFVVEDCNSGQRFGLFTDLGHVFRGLENVIDSLDAVLLESNYDEQMLRTGPYPRYLKDRIAGKRGHLSNSEAALLIDRCDASQLQWVCLGHLSAQNNTPELALATHRGLHGDRFSLYCADRDGVTLLPIIKPNTFTLRSA